MNVSGASLEAGSLSGNSLQRCPKTRTPGWLARLLPCHSSVGSLTGSVTVPADLAKLAASPRPQKIPLSSFSPNYITSARFSSSFCRTGRAQPAISTRLTASLAACGDTP